MLQLARSIIDGTFTGRRTLRGLMRRVLTRILAGTENDVSRAVKAVSWTNRLKTGIISDSIGAVSMYFLLWMAVPVALLCARSSMDRRLPSEGRGCWFDPSRAHQMTGVSAKIHPRGTTRINHNSSRSAPQVPRI